MSEYIRKDRVLSLLGLNHNDYVYLDKRELAQKIETLPSVDADPQWISVDEELPERGQVVLVASADRKTWDVGQFQGVAGWTDDKQMWNWKKKTHRRVDYWMPKDAIPLPRKGAEHEAD